MSIYGCPRRFCLNDMMYVGFNESGEVDFELISNGGFRILFHLSSEEVDFVAKWSKIAKEHGLVKE